MSALAFYLCAVIFSGILLVIGPVAHLVEHVICNDGVAGSSPVGSTEKIFLIYLVYVE